jgi:hypothetical protein
MEAALALVGEHDDFAAVEDALHKVPLARLPVPGTVDRAWANDRRRNSASLEQCPLDRGFAGRIRRVSGRYRRLTLGNRHRQPRQIIRTRRLVQRPALLVGVNGRARDRDQRADALAEREQLLGVSGPERDHVHEHVHPRDGLFQARGVGPVDLHVPNAVRQLALPAARDRYVPPRLRKPASRGAADEACASEDESLTQLSAGADGLEPSVRSVRTIWRRS